jgi:hypothetical protein
MCLLLFQEKKTKNSNGAERRKASKGRSGITDKPVSIADEVHKDAVISLPSGSDSE